MSTETMDIRTRVKKQIAAAQGLRMESMQRQGRALIVKANTPATSTGSTPRIK